MSLPTRARRFLARKLRGAARRLDPAADAPVTENSDHFIRWLTFAIPGMLHPGNLLAFETALRDFPPDTAVLEIGSFCGLSANVIAHYKRRYRRPEPVFTCDRWIFEGTGAPDEIMDTSGVSFGEYRRHVRDSFIRNVQLFSRNQLPSTIEFYSDEFFAAWDRREELTDVFGRPTRLGGPLGFCYIDGNHTYDFARRDFENTDRHLVPGGYILFDDSADGSGWEVCQVVKEVQDSGRYELVLKNPNYLFRKL